MFAGPSTSAQREDGMQLDSDAAKRFYLQYFFPPSCVGETGRVGGVSRRELGHGSLAERGLAPTIPSEVFPFPCSLHPLPACTHLQMGSACMLYRILTLSLSNRANAWA